jgi:methionyl-tRNA formyltransferase
MGAMRVLFLGASDSTILAHLHQLGVDVIQTSDIIADETADIIVSHGYRHILRQETLDRFPVAINLHVSYLPWNRGADPNFWSWVDNTPKGVTIHHIDAGIDTGDLIARREVEFEGEEWTLASSYDHLQDVLLDLFRDVWPLVTDGRAPRIRQEDGGSFHLSADRAPYDELLSDQWDTPVAEVSRLRRPASSNARASDGASASPTDEDRS